MSKYDLSLRKSLYFTEDQSAQLSGFIQQQRILKAIKKLDIKEDLLEEMIDKIIDCNDKSIRKIYHEMKEKGIEKAALSIQRLRMSKNQK